MLKETRIGLPPTWGFYPARLGRLERFVFKEITHTAVPHVDSLSGTTWVVTISGYYSGGFLIANCAGKECTARCSQRVAQRFSDVCTLWSSYQWANISAEPHVASNVRYIAFAMSVRPYFFEARHALSRYSILATNAKKSRSESSLRDFRFYCASGWAWTNDPLINSQVL